MMREAWETDEDAARWPPVEDDYQGCPGHDPETCIICRARAGVS